MIGKKGGGGGLLTDKSPKKTHPDKEKIMI
jgi:hypothetical protein